MEKEKIEKEKERKIRLIEEFYKENGRFPKQVETAPDGTRIGKFLGNIKRGDTKITEEQKRRLDTIGFFENSIAEEKERKIRLIEEFYKENGRLPKEVETAPDGTRIGKFLNNIKSGNTKITEVQNRHLEAIGSFESSIEVEKERKIRLIEEFYKENGRLPKMVEIAPDGTKIGKFLSNVKSGNTKITEEQKRCLEVFGFFESSIGDEKERKIRLIEEFYKKNGRLPKIAETAADGTKIGRFLDSIKRGNTKITNEQKRCLEAIGSFEISIRDEKERKIRLIEEFYEENGRLPKIEETALDGTKIGKFLSNVKSGNTKINERQQERLRILNSGNTSTKLEERQQIIAWLKRAREFLRTDSCISEVPKEKGKIKKL